MISQFYIVKIDVEFMYRKFNRLIDINRRL
jgi:hypothetical protein